MCRSMSYPSTYIGVARYLPLMSRRRVLSSLPTTRSPKQVTWIFVEMGNTELGEVEEGCPILEVFTFEAIRSDIHFCLPCEFFPWCLVILMPFDPFGKNFDAQVTEVLTDKRGDVHVDGWVILRRLVCCIYEPA